MSALWKIQPTSNSFTTSIIDIWSSTSWWTSDWKPLYSWSCSHNELLPAGAFAPNSLLSVLLLSFYNLSAVSATTHVEKPGQVLTSSSWLRLLQAGSQCCSRSCPALGRMPQLIMWACVRLIGWMGYVNFYSRGCQNPVFASKIWSYKSRFLCLKIDNNKIGFDLSLQAARIRNKAVKAILKLPEKKSLLQLFSFNATV